jgi:hypothetical protein
MAIAGTVGDGTAMLAAPRGAASRTITVFFYLWDGASSPAPGAKSV